MQRGLDGPRAPAPSVRTTRATLRTC
jgi:hypothetical protein